jgi:phage shock protein A
MSIITQMGGGGNEGRIAALESEVARLRELVESVRDRLERAESEAAIKESIEQFNRGEGIPAREAFERLRKKYNIPAR